MGLNIQACPAGISRVKLIICFFSVADVIRLHCTRTRTLDSRVSNLAQSAATKGRKRKQDDAAGPTEPQAKKATRTPKAKASPKAKTSAKGKAKAKSAGKKK